MVKVVGIGHCAVDYIGIIPRYPEPDEKIELEEFSQQGGGPVATALVTLSLLGIKTRFIGKISDDHFGEFIKQGLEGVGVDTSFMVIRRGNISPFSFSAVDRSKATRTIFWTRGNVGKLTLEEVDLEGALNGAEVLLIDGHFPDVQIKAGEFAKKHGMKVVFDAGSVREGIGDIIEFTDYLVASERFAMELALGSELEGILKELKKLGPQVVVITLGAEGSIGFDGKDIIKVPAYRDVEVIDTTGAGDVYHGAFIYGILNDFSLKDTMKFATIAAALKCRRIGGRAGIPRLQEVMSHFENWEI